jgi:hypothetical protein
VRWGRDGDGAGVLGRVVTPGGAVVAVPVGRRVEDRVGPAVRVPDGSGGAVDVLAEVVAEVLAVGGAGVAVQPARPDEDVARRATANRTVAGDRCSARVVLMLRD